MLGPSLLFLYHMQAHAVQQSNLKTITENDLLAKLLPVDLQKCTLAAVDQLCLEVPDKCGL